MNRRFILTLLSALFFITVAPVHAQQEKKVYRVCVFQNPALPPSFFEAFLRGMQERGWNDEKNIVIERRAHSQTSVAELIRLGVDVIVATGTGAVLDAKKVRATVPIVMSPAADAIAGGLVQSLAHPGGNVTGLTMITSDLAGKRLDVLKEAIPGIASVAAVYPVSSKSTALVPWLATTEAVAQKHRLKFRKLGLEADTATWESVIKEVARDPKTALVVIENAGLISQRTRIAELALRYRLPTMFSVKEHVEVGGLLSYGPDLVDVHYRAATYVDKILKGRIPADLPVEQPMKFEFIINLKSAKEIGLSIPQWTLMKADRVIK